MNFEKLKINNLSWEKCYSICTLVSDFKQYEEMHKTFILADFTEADTEYLVIDNSQNNCFDGYSGFNHFLNRSLGKYIIVCHQDLRLDFDKRAKLETCLAELDEIDPLWAVVGNAGATGFGHIHARISDPYKQDLSRGDFPARVFSLDENFILVKNSANLAVSHDLSGFHLYGTDLCLIADILGQTCYVVDFHLRHLSAGTVDERFYNVRDNLVRKYMRALRPRFMQTMIDRFFLSGSRFLNLCLNHKRLLVLIKSLVRKFN